MTFHDIPMEMESLGRTNNNVDLVDQQLNTHAKIVPSLRADQHLETLIQQLLEPKKEKSDVIQHNHKEEQLPLHVPVQIDCPAISRKQYRQVQQS